jgi:3-deoxy-D-manno-octulosonate 8-phosphate phosphatase (KDO 8-P phosphatase)
MNKLLFCDVDGTLTDGNLYLSNFGVETLKYSVYDGIAFKELKKLGFKVFIVSGRNTFSSYFRLRKFGINKFFFNIKDKEKVIAKIISKTKNPVTFYFGDEENDLSSMKLCNYIGCPNNANENVKIISNYISPLSGGSGALRDFYISFISKLTL